MKMFIAALVATTFAMGSAFAQAPAAPAAPDTPVATPVHKKAATKAKHKKAPSRKLHAKKAAAV
ncbi:MAG: hypothetical protein JWN73_2246 [Betaproteobacteria bacterium]|nr:hypothetical protein [Betaproteobacteria bacterium]